MKMTASGSQNRPNKYCTKTTGKSLLFVIALPVFLLFSRHCFSQSPYTWIGGTGDWSLESNWDPPASAGIGFQDEVIISSGTVNIDLASSVGNLTLNGGATIDGTENLTIEGTFTWNSGTLSGAGTIECTNILDIQDVGFKAIMGRTLSLKSGTGNWNADDIFIDGGSSLLVTDGGTLNIAFTGTQSINGTGTFQVDNGAKIVLSEVSTANVNTIFVADGAEPMEINGFLDFLPGSSSAHSAVSYQIGTNGKLKFSGGTHNFELGAETVGTGTLQINDGIINFNNANSLQSNVEMTGGIISGTGNPNILGTFDWIGGDIEMENDLTVAGILNIQQADPKEITGGSLVMTGVGTWSGGNISIGSGAMFEVNGTLNASHGGNLEFSLGSNPDGIVKIGQGGNFIKADGTTISIFGVLDITEGQVTVEAGTLNTAPNCSSTCTSGITIDVGAIFSLTGGTHNFSGASVSGNGLFLVEGATVNFSATTLNTHLKITSGALSVSSNITPKNVEISGGTFSGNGNPTASGSLLWSGGTVSGSGTFSVAGTSTFPAGTRTLNNKHIQMNGNATWSGGDFVFSGTAKLQLASLRTLSITHSGTQNITGTGTLEIDGTLEKTGSTSTSNINVGFVNDGMVKGVGTLNYQTLSNNAIYAPGFSPGKLSVNSFNNTGATLNMEILSTGTPGVAFDQLEVTGNSVLAGTLNVTFLNPLFNPNVGDEFPIVLCNTCSGNFGTLNLPNLAPYNKAWTIDNKPVSYVLTVVSALPVTLTRFEATLADDRSVLLFWETESEQNNEGFRVERSMDGTNWQSIAYVPGNGTTNSRHPYHCSDLPSSSGVYYYRLQQMDFDGKAQISPIRSITLSDIGDESGLVIFPNPVSAALLNIRLPEDWEEKEVKMLVFDANGSLLFSEKFEAAGIKELSVREWASGVYLLRFLAGNQSLTKRVTVK